MPQALDVQGQWFRDYSNNLGAYLRKHGREDHDQSIPIIVSSILAYKPQFAEWKALANVIKRAYGAADRETNADYEKLLRRAAQKGSVADLRLTGQHS